MKYKCLVLDHDDTTVNSTPVIHYPAFCKILEDLRPEKHYSMAEFLTMNFNPGLVSFYRDELSMSEEEMLHETDVWKTFLDRVVPKFFLGMSEIIQRQKEGGGLVCVVSHSFCDYILRDYRNAGVCEPDMLFGWDADRSHCKPNPYPLQQIMRRFDLSPKEILMVDDLPMGMEMAHSVGVDFASAMWGYDVPEVRSSMETEAEYMLTSVSELEDLLFGDENER